MKIKDQFLNAIKKADNILITFPVDWEGDAIAGALSLYLYLKKIGKRVEVGAEKMKKEHNFSLPSKTFKFLPAFSEIKSSLENLMKFIVSVDLKNAKVSQIRYTIENNYLNFIISPKEGFFTSNDIRSSMRGFKYDLIITVSCRDLESLGPIYDNNIDFFYKTNIINIDYSPENEDFGQINIIDLAAVSSTEIIYNLLADNQEGLNLIDENIATCLLTGIIFKTKSFKTVNITPKSLKISSKLIELGARREEIVANLYRSRSLATLKLWGRVLDNLSSSEDQSIVWSALFKNDFISTKSSEENIQDVIDELILSIPNAKVIAIFYSLNESLIADKNNFLEEPSSAKNLRPDNKTISSHSAQEPLATKVLIYSLKNINSLDLIKDYQPQGTSTLAQATVNCSLKELEFRVIEKIKNHLEKIF